MSGDPGKTVYGEIKIFNEQSEIKNFFSSFENFEPSGDSGAPRFVGRTDGLATWLETERFISLNPGETKTIPFSVVIPPNAEPGGYFAAIFWGSQAPGAQGGSDVSIGGKIGILVLLRVTGDVKEAGGVVSFHTKDKHRFFTSLPISFEYRVHNDGGDRIVPLGDIKIKNTLRLTSDTLPANKNEGSVLPNSARKFDVVWGKQTRENTENEVGFFGMARRQLGDIHIGWYTAELHVVLGSDNQVIEKTFNFFVIPWQLLTIVGAILIVVVILGRIILKKYNRWIIAQATQKNG